MTPFAYALISHFWVMGTVRQGSPRLRVGANKTKIEASRERERPESSPRREKCLFESAHIRIESESGTATLWLDFLAPPSTRSDLTHLRELQAALTAVEQDRLVNLLVIRSGRPGGFCSGIHPAALASLTGNVASAAFSWFGQQVFDQIAKLSVATLCFIDGPCLGAGFELALACDYRLCRCQTDESARLSVRPAWHSARLRRHGSARSTRRPIHR